MKKSQELIKSQDIFPDTHHFIFKGKQYPIKIAFFNLSSEYFQTNEQLIKGSTNIQLIDDKTESNIRIKEEHVIDFIQYVHQEPIAITEDNAISLEFLSNKYGVKSLLNYTKNYIQNHENDLVLKILINHQNDQKFIATTYENIVIENFSKYENNDDLFDLNFPILHRILSKIPNKGQNQDSKIDLYFKCLDKYGRVASILFDGFEFEKYPIKYFDLLMTKYFNIFDFHFINEGMLKKLYEKQKEQKQKISINENEIAKLNEYIKKLNETIQEQRIKNDEEISNLKVEITREKEKNQNEIQQHNDEKQKYEQERNNLLKNIDELKKEIIKLNPQIEEHKYKPSSNKGLLQYINEKVTETNNNDIIDIYKSSIGYHFDAYKKLRSCVRKLNNLCNDCTDGFICFDFKNYEIKISDYSIKSYNWKKNKAHLKNWVIEISNDGKKWEIIDNHSDYAELNSPRVTKIFKVNSDHFARYCRLRNTGEFYGKDDGWALEIDHIELFGQFK